MTEPHKQSHRHPKYTTAYRVKNWRGYDQSLRDRGDIALWISQDAIDAWTPPMTGKRGTQAIYSEVAIETALMSGCSFACRYGKRRAASMPS